MSTPDVCKGYVSRPITASTRPSLDEVDEIMYSENQQQNEEVEAIDSCCTSNGIDSREYASSVSKSLTYDIFKRYFQMNPQFAFENNSDITLDGAAKNPEEKDPKNEKTADDSVASARRRNSIGLNYEVPSETEVNSYHYSRSNSVCNIKIKRFISRATALSHTGLLDSNEKKRAEKMTYCRPVTKHFYNEEFIFKTTERNRRLQKLVQKMAIAREKEKQQNAWNDYINNLKQKHRFNAHSANGPVPCSSGRTGPEIIEDFYKTNFKCQQSNTCRNLLKDFYQPCTSNENNFYDNYGKSDYRRNLKIQNNPNATVNRDQSESYILSSLPIIILNRDKSNQCEIRCAINDYCIPEKTDSNTILLDRRYSKNEELATKASKSTVVYKKKKSRVQKNSSIQTDLKLLPLKVAKHESVETSTTVNKKTSENTNEIKTQRQGSLSSIESKLEVLIQSINTLVTEIKAKPVSQCLTNNSKMTISRSIETVPPNTEPVLQKLDENRISQLKCNSPCLFQNTNVGKIDKILLEEINKSNEVKKDIENILNGNVSKSCAVQITADHIPTREHSTEVTDSLLKTEVNSTVDQQRMIPEENRTMAVNTDPLGLLALLRISKESVKHVLSYMQNFPYQYLLQLPFPKENSITPFICSICRAGFTTPSLLTEHTQSHVRNRDCCVCRHLTGAQANDDKALNPRRMFCCEFCRKPFSRAYCCELHQMTCAKRLGKLCDVTSSLILLR